MEKVIAVGGLCSMYAYLGAYIVKYYMKYIHVGTYIG